MRQDVRIVLQALAEKIAEDVDASRRRRAAQIDEVLRGRPQSEVEYFRSLLVDLLAGHGQRTTDKQDMEDDGMESRSEVGVLSVAKSMWELVRGSHDRDWGWLLKNDPHLAVELQVRARNAIEAGGLVQADLPDASDVPLDLRLKQVLTGGSR